MGLIVRLISYAGAFIKRLRLGPSWAIMPYRYLSERGRVRTGHFLMDLSGIVEKYNEEASYEAQ